LTWLLRTILFVGLIVAITKLGIAWAGKLVVFTPTATVSEINTRITTLNQLNALVATGHGAVLDTPIRFNYSITSERTYELGTPVVIPFP